MHASKSQKVVSKLLLALMLNIGVVNVAQALSPYQWEYWGFTQQQLYQLANISPNLYIVIASYINNEMRRVATNQGNLLNISNNNASFSATHVGYARFNYSCGDVATCNNKIATFQLLPNATAQTLQIESNMNVYDLSAPTPGSLLGVQADQFQYQKTAFYAGPIDSTAYLNISGASNGGLNISGYDPNAGFIGAQSSFFGSGYWGKIATASQLTALASVNSYGLSGSVPNFGTVNMTLNFTNSTWSGNWSAGTPGSYNAFTVNGTISSATLTGSLASQTGIGASTVTQAVVNGTIVDLGGSGIGAIGAANITTQGNGTIGTVFRVTPGP